MSDVWTIERHLEAGSDHGRALFHRFVDIVAACGAYTTSVAKTTTTQFRVASLEQMDDELIRWIADAYDQVGCGNR